MNTSCPIPESVPNLAAVPQNKPNRKRKGREINQSENTPGSFYVSPEKKSENRNRNHNRDIDTSGSRNTVK